MSLSQTKRDIKYLSGKTGAKRERPPDPEPEEEICSICHEPLVDNPPLTTTPCNHQFHRECLCQWLHFGSRTNCPVCRRRFTELQVEAMCGRVPNKSSKASRRLFDFDILENQAERDARGLGQSRVIPDDGDW